MKSDPIVEEVRAIRRKIMSQFGNDPKQYWEHLRQLGAQHPDDYLAPEDLDHVRQRAVAEPPASYGSNDACIRP